MNKAIVFGASSELGAEISAQLDRSFETTRASTKYLRTLDTEFSYATANSQTIKSLGLDLSCYKVIVFNQALTILKDIVDISSNEVISSYLINSIFPLEVIKAFLSVSSGFHRFIFISSVAGSIRSESASVAYSSSKRAIHGLVKHLSFSHGSQCDFIAIAPSQINSISLKANLTPRQISTFKSKNPTGELCTLSEISYLVYCLANYPGRHINGSIIDLNGGIF